MNLQWQKIYSSLDKVARNSALFFVFDSLSRTFCVASVGVGESLAIMLAIRLSNHICFKVFSFSKSSSLLVLLGVIFMDGKILFSANFLLR